jgi:superfamily II DNA or RNA helicase
MTMGLDGLDLLTSYHRGENNIAEEFYLPAMRRATRYDRAVGFFRSAAFIISWPALRDFVARGGRMRVLCSQVLSPEDIGALDEGYAARIDVQVAARLRAEVASLLADPEMGQPARILAALVGSGVIEFRVAIWRPSDKGPLSRIFHDKLGFFRDDAGAVVMFKGSMNETWMGLAADGNLESVDVALSWFDGRERERVEREDAYFERIWDGTYPGLIVRPFPDTARDDLVRAADPDWEGSIERMLRDSAGEPEDEGDLDPLRLGRPLMRHQTDGLEAWRTNGRRGIFAFATGAGKTFTALIAAEESITRYGEVPVIVVPDRTLFDQWLRDVIPFADRLDARLLRVGSGNNRWRDYLRSWTAPGAGRRIVLATLPTARSEDFRRRLAGGRHLLLIGDEAHRLGSRGGQALLDEALFGPRLGLSATPERAGDQVGTAAILGFFGGVLEPRFTLDDAIAADVLTPYFYRPHRVELSDDEIEQWREVSRRLARAMFAGGEPADGGIPRSAEMLLFERARIVKAAAAKVPLAVDILSAEYRPGQRWIVYCDSEAQLADVRGALRAAGFTPRAYTSAMPADREATIRWFTEIGGVLVAIRCFDEGVDIPGITHALILASSKNPREFIQRRGRVLRKADGKTLAYVHDAIVVPPPPRAGEDAQPDPITAGELSRALQFAQGASNHGAAADLLDIAIDAGIDWRTMFSMGVEDQDDD